MNEKKLIITDEAAAKTDAMLNELSSRRAAAKRGVDFTKESAAAAVAKWEKGAKANQCTLAAVFNTKAQCWTVELGVTEVVGWAFRTNEELEIYAENFCDLETGLKRGK